MVRSLGITTITMAMTAVTALAPQSARPSRLTRTSLASTTAETKRGGTMYAVFGKDEEKMLMRSTFPIAPNKLMERAKVVLSPQVALGTKDGGACLADDFEFVAAVVGPISKTEYLNALQTFDLEKSFDLTSNFFGMSVDPFQTNRVWFFNRVQAKHTGTFMGAPASGMDITYPPQVHHLDFNSDGQVREYGFYTADRRIGNTGGLGGAFGFMYAVGKPLPIPECQPYKPSLRFRLLNTVGGLLRKLQK